MGVLEARADAEKVGYSIIGEETKEKPNVIDYNIQKEITKDESAISNANNATTTGMATVIPGINAPKLIASTSIYGMEAKSYSGGIWAEFESPDAINVPVGDFTEVELTNVVSTNNEWGDFKFKIVPGKGIIMPVNGAYTLDLMYARTGHGTGVELTFKTMIGKKQVRTSGVLTSPGGTTDTVKVNATRGSNLYFDIEIENVTSTTRSVKPFVWITITKGA